MKDQFVAILLFCIGLLFHYVTFQLLGKQYYLLVLGFPMLSFAWVLSLLVYIFHYDTTIGEEVRYVDHQHALWTAFLQPQKGDRRHTPRDQQWAEDGHDEEAGLADARDELAPDDESDLVHGPVVSCRLSVVG